CQQYFNLHTF
nr:immunoglobulin light chain junction region [Homo sapiens]